jgi:hypothetical protein
VIYPVENEKRAALSDSPFPFLTKPAKALLLRFGTRENLPINL